jgi:hypothetical protein
MNFSTEAEERLGNWIGRSTWYTEHPDNNSDFYRFVRALWESNKRAIDEDKLAERILSQVMGCGGWDEDAAREYITEHRYANRAQEILNYHTANGDETR